MDQSAVQKFTEHLTFEGRLGVAWSPHQPESLDWLARINADNLNILNVVASTQEHRSDVSDDSPLPQELIRLEAKLNLILDLVSGMVEPNSANLPLVPVRFNAFGITWQSKRESDIGTSGVITVYLETFRAKPLVLPGYLVDLTTTDENAGWTTAIFQGLSESVQEVMERLVFRYHRRKIAESRQAIKMHEI